MGTQATAEQIQTRGLEKLLSFGDMAIDVNYGLRVLNQYISELNELSMGVPFSALGMSARREQGRSAVIMQDGVELKGDAALPSAGKQAGKVALIRLEGPMTSMDGACSYGVQHTAGLLRQAYQRPDISGIVLEINSGGGELIAMNIMTSALSERNKPVVSFSHFSASAAYGTAAMTDEIVASDPMAEFGSIGAMISLNKEFLTWYKDNYLTFYGSNAPKKNDAFRKALEGDFAPMQEAVNKATDQFHAMIRTARDLKGNDTTQTETLSGQIFSATEARRRGLIDGIGNLAYAGKRAQSWARKYQSQ